MSDNETSGSAGAQPSRRVQAIEVCVFLMLIVPSMALSFFAEAQGGLSFTLTAVATILRDLALLGLILYFIWRNGEPLGRIGWRSAAGWTEVMWGIGLFIPLLLGAGLLDHVLQEAGLSAPATPLPGFLSATGAGGYLLAFVLVIVVALAEETIFRGYLLLRLKAVTGSPAAAVLLSAAIFSLGHGYEGTAGVITVGALGLVFALVYLWRRSLIAPMVMHFLQDFVGVILLPLLSAK